MLSIFRKGGATPFEKQIIGNVERHGCHINWVFDDKAAEPPFAYSIGFAKSLNVPEVIIFGLPQETSFQAINTLLARCAEGQVLEEGERIAGLFGSDFDCIVRMVDESWLIQSLFSSALWFHRTQMDSPLRAVAMLVWPDAEHRYPWEDDCADWVRADQPELYKPRLNT